MDQKLCSLKENRRNLNSYNYHIQLKKKIIRITDKCHTITDEDRQHNKFLLKIMSSNQIYTVQKGNIKWSFKCMHKMCKMGILTCKEIKYIASRACFRISGSSTDSLSCESAFASSSGIFDVSS